MTMKELFDNARDVLDESLLYAIEEGDLDPERPDRFEPHDLIFEAADSSVPVYTSELMELAAENIELATSEPELGPAFGGEPTPTNIVAANVFEAIEQDLWEYWRELVDDFPPIEFVISRKALNGFGL